MESTLGCYGRFAASLDSHQLPDRRTSLVHIAASSLVVPFCGAIFKLERIAWLANYTFGRAS
jgi:hypothetical protein